MHKAGTDWGTLGLGRAVSETGKQQLLVARTRERHLVQSRGNSFTERHPQKAVGLLLSSYYAHAAFVWVGRYRA